MSTRYPAAYRPGAYNPSTGGYQSPAGGSEAFRELLTRTEGSREFHKLVQKKPREGTSVPVTPKPAFGRRSGGGIARRAFRVHPAARVALWAWENLEPPQHINYHPEVEYWPPGWILEHTCPSQGGPIMRGDANAAPQFAWCNEWVVGPTGTINPGAINVYVWEYRSWYDPGHNYWNAVEIERWWRNTATENPTFSPEGWGELGYDTKTAENPAWNPETLFPQQPQPQPQAVPYTALPHRPAHPQVTTVTSGGGSPRLPTYVYRSPPGKRQKERKLQTNLPGIVLAIQKLGHGVTEALDAIDAIFDALPKARQKGATTPQAKLMRIYRYFDEIDMNAAMLNLIANHVSDAVLGRVSGGAQKYATEHGVTLGRTGLSPIGI